MKTLYLLRHAKAEPARGRETDSERTLSVNGQQTCQLVGAYMKAKHYLPEQVVASAARRTVETCEMTLKAAGINPPVDVQKNLYLATAEDLLHAIRQMEDGTPSVMMVGHNPGLHHLALALAEPVHSNLYVLLDIKYPTGALAVLHFDCASWQDISPGRGELADFMTPCSTQN